MLKMDAETHVELCIKRILKFLNLNQNFNDSKVLHKDTNIKFHANLILGCLLLHTYRVLNSLSKFERSCAGLQMHI
jgi:hypothetical protein